MFSWESLHSISVGGVAPHVTELAAALQRRNHEVHVFTRRADGQQLHEEHDLFIFLHICSILCLTDRD
jgi:glycogen synthase